MNFKFMALKDIMKYEPEMKRLQVSEVARSARGFLTEYKNASGDHRKLSAWWKITRTNFIKRHLVQYKKHPTYRRLLALYAWAYDPSTM